MDYSAIRFAVLKGKMNPHSKKRHRPESKEPLFDVNDFDQLKFISTCILAGDRCEKIKFLLECANLDPEDVYTTAIMNITNDAKLSDKEKNSKVKNLLVKLEIFKSFLRTEQSMERNYYIDKKLFMEDFYFHFNLDKHSGEYPNENLESYQYILQNKDIEGYKKREFEVDSVKCRICKEQYPKFRQKGCVNVCVPCINQFVQYKLDEKVQQEKRKYEDDMRDFMKTVQMYFEDPLPSGTKE